MKPVELAKTYAGMEDYELLNLALEVHALTEDAKSALTAELAKRGLGAQAIGAQAEVIQELKRSSPLSAFPPDDPNTASDGSTILGLGPSDAALEVANQKREKWLGDDRARFQLGIGIFLFCMLGYGFLIAYTPIPISVRSAVGRLFAAQLVAFFVMRKAWGNGWAALIVSLAAVLLLAYSAVPDLANGGASARTEKVATSLLSDVQERAGGYKREVGSLGIDTVFEMLDGKRAWKTADLVEMRRRAGVARDMTEELMAFFDERIKIAESELSAAGPPASSSVGGDLSSSTGTLHHALSLEKTYYVEIDQLLEFVISKSGRYQITPRGIRFDKPPDSSEYGRRIDEINETVAAINQIQQQSK